MTRRNLSTGFIDLLFLLLAAILAVVMIKTPIKTSEIQKRAEYMVVVSWPDDAMSDVDTWFRSPAGERLSYMNDMVSVYSLERDDLGHINDRVTLPDGSVQQLALNEEVVTLRGWVAGTYTVNLHVYSWRDEAPLKVVVKFFSINPYKLIAQRELTLDTSGQEETAMNVTLNAAGEMVDLSYEFRPLRNPQAVAPPP